jgi:predicted RNase H-like nuclease (RuvC/YqgF family)
MSKLLGLGALILGGVGVLLCAAIIGIAWWAAMKSADRLDQLANRVDHGLSEVDAPLARVESRLSALRADLDEVRGAAEKITDENPELPRIQAEIERLVDRLIPTLERADFLAESLRATAAAIRTAADVVDQFAGFRRHRARAQRQ